jgi:hypothetical protein
MVRLTGVAAGGRSACVGPGQAGAGRAEASRTGRPAAYGSGSGRGLGLRNGTELAAWAGAHGLYRKFAGSGKYFA